MRFRVVRSYREDLCGLIQELFPRAEPVFGEGHTYFVAEHEGEAVGFAHLMEKNGKLILQGIGVKGEMRHRGLGGELLDCAVRQAESEGKHLYLKVKPDNPAVKLYASRGFTIKKIKGAYILEKKLLT